MSDKETMEQKLLLLVATNPGIPILPCVDYDVCCDDTFSWWIGKITEVEVETRIYYDPMGKSEYDHVYFDESDKQEILEKIEDCICDNDGGELDPDQIEKEALRRYQLLKREKVIALRIGL